MERIQTVEIFWNGNRVGLLSETPEGICAFEYDSAFLKNGFPISPFELPLRSGLYLGKRNPFAGNFGVFDDCLPDGWGLLVLDRHLKLRGENLTQLSIPQRLSLVGSSGRGALEFVPDFGETNFRTDVVFEELSEEIEKIVSNTIYEGSGIEELYRQGGSPGGARPKIFTIYDGKEWMVKFKSNYDPPNIGQIEYNYSLLAKDCGIVMPETRLFEGKFFATERFDRMQGKKIHVVSAAGLLNADYRLPCLDYVSLFQLCRELTRNELEIWKLYRLMCFNYLIGNKDDHAKNFSFRYHNDSWELSPGYDLLPSDGIQGYHTTSVNHSIKPLDTDIIAVAEKSGLSKTKALSMFEEIKQTIQAFNANTLKS